MENLSPQIQNQIAQLQQVQQQAQAVTGQKVQVEMALNEANMTLEELEKIEDEPIIYQIIGNILVKSDKAKVKEKLSEQKETFELRLKTLERQEERIQKRFSQLQQQIREALGDTSPPVAQ